MLCNSWEAPSLCGAEEAVLGQDSSRAVLWAPAAILQSSPLPHTQHSDRAPLW